MLDLIESLQAGALDARARRAVKARPTLRPRDYDGPERRNGSATQRRLMQVLDTLDYGLVLLHEDEADRVALMNKAARMTLDDHHPLRLQGEYLSARLGKDGPALREALAGAAQRGLRRLLYLGERDRRQPLAVVPLPPATADGLHGVALVMGRRQVCEELSVDWFARAHSLTLAESAIVRGLCADLTPQQIAERQGVGLATVRTQISSIRTKTGAGSIRALVRQISLLPPLVNALQTGGAGAGAGAGAALGAGFGVPQGSWLS